ncbi:hypothetical protein LRP67_19585 [Nocardioides sp. cx-169]|uniref:hypothetical protein n=1 Tax=Nocardioides sp. cx-169 TaxID=2899080 RepID=UPI001E42DBD7|nr:hypothetical protein [Nocardioides sp. cx-169]MCD4536300.1 hypothetical protein [Nocardioides sp. cx-169]
MDAAPTTFAELPLDPRLGVPVPFACSSPRDLDKRRVTQCALSRVCGVCGAGLGRPIAFLGTGREEARNAFHFPPTHEECATALLAAYDGVGEGVLGQDEAVNAWVLVTTAAFEFVRPGREDLDRRPTFQPTAVLSR